MRRYLEPSARNLLRPALVMGVPLTGMILLSSVVLTLTTLSGTNFKGNLFAFGVGLVGYAGLRVLQRFALTGWEQRLLWWIESAVAKKAASLSLIQISPSSYLVQAPDTLDQVELLRAKDEWANRLTALRAKRRLTLMAEITGQGARLMELQADPQAKLPRKPEWKLLTSGIYTGLEHVYSLHSLPVVTDPLWLFSVLKDLSGDVRVLVSFQGLDARKIKRRIEVSRRRSSRGEALLSNVDSDITFEEATDVLRGLSRGDESVVDASLVLVSKTPLDLDPALFIQETNPALSVSGVLGLRRLYHRSHLVRVVTACDLIPNILDPVEGAAEILKTPRGNPLYFSPNDSRLEALHWLVVGATGSGKSFFTGLVLRRMIEGGEKLSVLFLDHGRSFRRLVRSMRGQYVELSEETSEREDVIDPVASLAEVGTVSGIELSDLGVGAKKDALRCIFQHLESLLKSRDSVHPVYVVLDECWNFLRDDPVLVQRAFREFRKLNGAVIAITQSLSDFVTTQTGQTIFQNAPVRILLRQGEDLTAFRGALGLNDVEFDRLRLLRQVRGEYSECLIKTPYLSRLGRLYPSGSEHEVLRTDNLRAEWVQEHRSASRPVSVLALTVLLLSVFTYSPQTQAAFGLEMAPLMKLVAGQVAEIERLTQQVGIAKDNHALLIELNQGIDKTVSQIQSVESVLERAQGLDPRAVRSISELNAYMARTREAKRAVEELMELRSDAASIAIQQSALQGETAYLMGQEMMATGATLAQDSRLASPGRAAQITAASSSAQMLAQGVQLQTLSQIAQLQAMQLELLRSQYDQQRNERKQQDEMFRQVVSMRKGGGK